MNSFWMSAAALGLVFTIGCGGTDETSRETGAETAPPAANAPSESPEGTASDPGAPASPAEDTTAAPERSTGQQAPRPAPGRQTARSNANAPAAEPGGGTTEAERPAEPTPAPAAPTRRAAEWREVTVPEGTAVPLELETALSSETAQVEMPVRARVRQAVIVDGIVAIPSGAVMSGVVTQVERAGRVKGRAQLAFAFNRLQAENVREDVNTSPITYVAEATKGEDATKVGVGAVGGAIVGGILGGGKGAARGAAVGGAAGTGVVLATRGEEVTLAKGTNLSASLASPLTVRVPAQP